MKVICASLSKTGTKSMCAALRMLDYSVYDYLKNCELLNEEWTKIFKEEGTVEDFRMMYENVDAVTDVPSCIFWEEISQAFPDAKIIFSMRESEDEWLESMVKQSASYDAPYIKMLHTLSPTYRKIRRYTNAICIMAFGFIRRQSLFGISPVNRLLMRQAYREHNAYVLEKAPKDRFLHFNPKDGWGPLCKFLGADVPEMPFSS